MSESCPICGGKSYESWNKGQLYELLTCRGCSLVFLNREHDYADFFEAAQSEYFGDGYLRRRDLLTRRFLLNKAARRMEFVRRFVPGGRLLDVGPGGGELMLQAKRLGYEVVGLEESSPLAQHIRSSYSLTVYQGTLEQVTCQEPFDVIIMSHVLEHAVDPVRMLEAAMQWLKPDGYLYVAVPNVGCWEAQWRGWTAYEPYHIWYFSPTTLSTLLENTGFDLRCLYTAEPYAAWLNTILRTLSPSRLNRVRSAVIQDRSQLRHSLYLGGMLALQAARFTSGILLTPLRHHQERQQKGEELIVMSQVSERAKK